MTARRAIIRAAALAAGLLTTAGCSPLAAPRDEARLLTGGRHHVIDGLDVPAVAGPAGCGAQALAAILAYDDPMTDAQQLADELPWQDLGATPVDLLLEARARGRVAAVERGDWTTLRGLVLSRRPALVMLDAGREVRTLTSRIPSTPLMHWAVLSGMARDGSAILLAATGRRHHVLSRDDFLRRWAASDHCLITIRPAIADPHDDTPVSGP